MLVPRKEVAEAERRKEKRYETVNCAAVISVDYPEVNCAGSIVDISRSGLRVRSDRRLGVQSIVIVRFGGTTVAGRILYCMRNQDGTFDSGVRIYEADRI
jgi:hypothetical protein